MNNNDLLSEWVEKLRSSEKLIVVEGKKDRAALMNIGIPSERIFTLKKPLFAVAEEIAKTGKGVIILTDLDSEGKRIYSRLREDLSRLGVVIDNYFREFLFKNSKLSHIEGIDTYIGRRVVEFG